MHARSVAAVGVVDLNGLLEIVLAALVPPPDARCGVDLPVKGR